jgi:uncharacterized Zn finger protein
MWYSGHYFPRSRPRQAKGGIKAQTKRGQFGQSWWAKRWIAVLESFSIGARLGRGRSYARNGQVLNIDIAKGEVTAKVQGSRPKPYDVTIQATSLVDKEWAKVIEALSGQALYTAKLLAGEMPQDIETVFHQVKLSLFPEKLGDLATECSCPDWSNPCKHIAAVYYLLGEEFDRDPFLLFRLRGLEREDLLRRLGASKGQQKIKAGCSDTPDHQRPSEPLPNDPDAFWNPGRLPDNLGGTVSVPRIAAALPKRLGNFPFWRGREHFLETMDGIYRAAAEAGLEVFLDKHRSGVAKSG